MHSFKCLILFLTTLFLTTLPVVSSIKCVRCQQLECTNLNLIPEDCPAEVDACVSILTEGWTEGHRFSIDRDCFLDKYRGLCTPMNMANQTCNYCDHKDGCNVERQEAVICRQCDYTTGKEGFECNHSVICQPMFRTVVPQCHTSWAEAIDGSHFGCWHRMNRKARHLQLEKDLVNLRTLRCSANECNTGLDKLFFNVTDLLEVRRFCYYGRPKRSSLVHCRNSVYEEPIIPFCMYARAATAAILRETDCYAFTYQARNIQRYLFVENGDSYFCNTNGCNKKQDSILYSCYGPNQGIYYVFKPTDACVSFNDPFEGYTPLGRMQLNYCTDYRRCFICRSHLCNSKENMMRLYCYHTTGPEGFYIRHEQLDYMDMCAKGQTQCVTIIDKEHVWRGCANGTEPATAIKCTGNLCNTVRAATYCFNCTISDPNCVFSQGDGRQFAFCGPQFLGCYTRIYGDGSVTRGCALKKEDPILDTVYNFCDDVKLCNDKTTKMHSCHLYNALIYDMPQLPSFVKRQWVTREGIAFETCPDEFGLPACYTRTYMIRRQAYHQSGCTNEISVAAFIHFRRGFGDTQSDTIMCDGHYCNQLPIDGASWIDAGSP